MSLRRKSLQALVCGDMLLLLWCLNMSCKGGNLQYAISLAEGP
jgi:hypothetical protein